MRKAAEAEAEGGERSEAAKKLEEPVKKKGQRTRGPQKLKFTYKEQKDYETIETDIAALEEKISARNREMEVFAHDFVKLNQLMEEKEELAARIAEQQ